MLAQSVLLHGVRPVYSVFNRRLVPASMSEAAKLKYYQKLVNVADDFNDVGNKRPMITKVMGSGTFADVVGISLPGQAIKFHKKQKEDGLAWELGIMSRLSRSSYVLRCFGTIRHNKVPVGIVVEMAECNLCDFQIRPGPILASSRTRISVYITAALVFLHERLELVFSLLRSIRC